MHASYPDYVAMFEQLTDDHIIWKPYTQKRVYAHVLGGLSSLYTRDHVYWYTRKALVHEVLVEEYQAQRVIRQLGLR